jgi:UDP-N-acetylglucosamine diphosphorylase/glucosamine-1-phosphate N-acetyltransferase
MKAVILAAGEGVRMRPLTSNKSKVMLPVANKPIIEHIVNTLIQAGIKEFILVVGYRAEQIEEHFGNGENWGVDIKYIRQEKPTGTADAVAMIEPVVEETFLVVNGDTLYRLADIKSMLSLPSPAMGVIQVEDAHGMGVITREGNFVKSIVEKASPPPTKTANAGVYLFDKRIFSAISSVKLSPRGENEIPDAIQLLINQGVTLRWHELSDWLTFSNPWDLLEGGKWIYTPSMMANLGTIEEGVVIKGEISVGQNTTIRSGSYISGPVIIGDNCDIGPNCFLRPFTSIGDGCHVGAFVEIKNSIIMTGTKVPHITYIGDSVVGEKCNFGAGTKIANLRFDDKNVRANTLDTGRRKLGAIIGDNVFTGVNASIDAGTIIGENSHIGPGIFVHGHIRAGSHILRNKLESTIQESAFDGAD